MHSKCVKLVISVQKTRFHVAQSLSYKKGYAIPTRPQYGVGGVPLPNNQLTDADLDELSNTRPTLTYGNPSKPAPVEFVPAHVAFDKKVKLYDRQVVRTACPVVCMHWVYMCQFADYT